METKYISTIQLKLIRNVFNISSKMYVSDDMLCIDFVFGRQLSGFIVTTVLPTVVANTLGYLTVFFEEEAFEAALGVNLTIVLVIVTM